MHTSLLTFSVLYSFSFPSSYINEQYFNFIKIFSYLFFLVQLLIETSGALLNNISPFLFLFLSYRFNAPSSSPILSLNPIRSSYFASPGPALGDSCSLVLPRPVTNGEGVVKSYTFYPVLTMWLMRYPSNHQPRCQYEVRSDNRPISEQEDNEVTMTTTMQSMTQQCATSL